MKYLFIILFLISCGKHKDTFVNTDLSDLQAKADFYCRDFNEDEILQRPGDKLTFSALLHAFCRPIVLQKYEWNPGEWHRNEVIVYHGENSSLNQSKSEISSDPFITLLHAFISDSSENSLINVKEIIAFGDKNKWVMGAGPKSLTFIPQIYPIYRNLRNHLEGKLNLSLEEADALPGLSGFRGYLASLYIYALGRMNGEISDTNFKILKGMDESNKMALALFNRFGGNDQQEIIDFLKDENLFPSNRIPIDDGIQGWGSCPAIVYFTTTLAIIKGK